MRIFLSLVILFALAIGLALGARFNPGNVVFFYPPYRVDMSLNFFLLLAGLSFVTLMLVLAAIRTTRQLPGRVAAYRREKREREGNKALREALKALFEGRFGHAEKAAERAAQNGENAPLASLVAARAAHRMGQPERRDAWLAFLVHEVKNPLNNVLNAIWLLREVALRGEPTAERFLALAERAVRRIEALVGEVRDLQQKAESPPPRSGAPGAPDPRGAG